MSDERYVRKGYKIWDTYSDREVQELNYRFQSDYMCEVLNEKESKINTLVKENEQLRQKLDFYLLDEFEWKEKYGDCDLNE